MENPEIFSMPLYPYDKDFNFFVELWLHLAYSESAPRFVNYLRGLYTVNISTM
jgi:hypothetical protein